jgi:hypothetical protein
LTLLLGFENQAKEGNSSFDFDLRDGGKNRSCVKHGPDQFYAELEKKRSLFSGGEKVSGRNPDRLQLHRPG